MAKEMSQNERAEKQRKLFGELGGSTYIAARLQKTPCSFYSPSIKEKGLPAADYTGFLQLAFEISQNYGKVVNVPIELFAFKEVTPASQCQIKPRLPTND